MKNSFINLLPEYIDRINSLPRLAFCKIAIRCIYIVSDIQGDLQERVRERDR